MGNINLSSILSKAKSFMKTDDGRDMAYDACNSYIEGKSNASAVSSSGNKITIKPEEAGEKFIEMLKIAISSAGLSPGVEDAISEDWSVTDISLVENEGKASRYEVSIEFTGDKFRFSLDVPRYVGIDNIVALYNNGVDHTMNQVWGNWVRKNKESGAWEEIENVGSRTVIPATHFMQDAVQRFEDEYKEKYYIDKIELHSDYTG